MYVQTSHIEGVCKLLVGVRTPTHFPIFSPLLNDPQKPNDWCAHSTHQSYKLLNSSTKATPSSWQMRIFHKIRVLNSNRCFVTHYKSYILNMYKKTSTVINGMVKKKNSRAPRTQLYELDLNRSSNALSTLDSSNISGHTMSGKVLLLASPTAE